MSTGSRAGGKGLRLGTQAPPRGGGAQAGDGAYASRLGLVHSPELGPSRCGVDLLFPSSPGPERAALTRREPPGDLHPGQAGPPGVRGILNTRAANRGRTGAGGILPSPWRNSATPSSFRAEPNQQGKSLAAGYKAGKVLSPAQRSVLQQRSRAFSSQRAACCPASGGR